MISTGIQPKPVTAVFGKNFNQFFVSLDIRPRCWEDRITLYVKYLIKEKWQSSTIKSYLSAIKAVLKINRIKLNMDDYLLSALMRACKLKNDRVRHRLPIHKGLLHILLQQVELLYSNQPYLAVLYRALFSTAYFGLFRIGELMATPGGHAVKACDIHLGYNKEKVLFILRTSKMHSKGNKPQKIKITSQEVGKVNSHKQQFCPYHLLREYINIKCGY